MNAKESPLPSDNKMWSWGIGLSLVALLFLAGSFHLSSFPAVWWDEGWTLSVARNWVERGFYGRFLAGEPAPPGLEAAFPVTAVVGLGFRLFGVGIWQGRLVGLFFMIGALALMYYLGLRLYNKKVALGTLFAILLMSPHPVLHPIFNAHQVLAELPMLFYLLSGYMFFVLAVQRSYWFQLPAMIFWGLALQAKAQAVPFWAVSLFVPLVLNLLGGKRRMSIFFGSALVGSPVAYAFFQWGQGLILQDHTLPVEPLRGMYEVIAIVFQEMNRLFALQVVLDNGLAVLIGLCFSAANFFTRLKQRASISDLEFVRLSLLVLAGSWMGWYLFLSLGLARYLFPPIFLGSIFLAAMMEDLTGHFHLRWAAARLWDFVKYRKFNPQFGGALLVLILVLLTLPSTLKSLYVEFSLNHDTSAVRISEILNTQTPPDALIETYDSELHFLLKRRVHYPPDQVHVELNRRAFLSQPVQIDYDPLKANPDYLVVGYQSRMWKLYDPVISSGKFRYAGTIGRYEVYERIR